MRDGWVLLFLFLALPTSVLAAEGTFQGTIVDAPRQAQAAPGWIFVQGRNRLVRRVDVTRATVVAAPGVLLGPSEKCGLDCLLVGQEVRVTAEQDGSGEWRAKLVEIVRPVGGPVPSKIAKADPSAVLGISPVAAPAQLRLARSQPALSERKRVEWARQNGSTTDPSAALGISPVGAPARLRLSHARQNGSTYETLHSQNRGCWITAPSRLCIQPLTEKSIITRWSGGIMNDVL